ncbi:MAG: hypothetical protein ACXVCP_06565 [Bdellovibrio sp.]
MKTVLMILAFSVLSFSAQAATLSCSFTEGIKDPEIKEISVDVSFDMNDTNTFVRNYEISKTAHGVISAQINNLKKELMVIFHGDKKEDLV